MRREESVQGDVTWGLDEDTPPEYDYKGKVSCISTSFKC